MSQPGNATLAQLAEQMGATPAEINALPPQVRNLTKGQLIDLWGADNPEGALSAYQQGQSSSIPAKAEGLHLTLTDITTIQAIFSPARVAPRLGGGSQPGGVADPQAVNVNCCCCPCCCAATAIQPVKYL